MAAEVGLEINPVDGEFLTLCNLECLSIDLSNGSATIRAGISVARPFPVLINPGEIMAALDAGGCPGSVNGTMDASDFLRTHLNSKVNASIAHCGQAHPNTSPYPISWRVWQSHNFQLASSKSSYFTDTYPYFWKSDDNECLGVPNTSNSWNNLYNRADALNLIGENGAYSQVGQANGILELLNTNYDSHSDGTVRLNQPSGPPYYHGGEFSYGVVYCI